MKLHDKTIERLIKLFTTYGGHRSEHRLKRELKNLGFSVYTKQSGEQILVMTDELQKAIVEQQRLR